jgi:RNA polymerase subunit RPABC4/transcription elongation factor Spt4
MECAACHKYVSVKSKQCPNCGAKLVRAQKPAPDPITLDIQRIDSEEDFGDLEVETPICEEDSTPVSLKLTPPKLEFFNDPRYFPRQIRDDHEAAVSRQICNCRHRVVHSPSGVCPHKLTSPAQEDVEAWAEKVMEWGHNNGVHYAPCALRYFVRQSFPVMKPAKLIATGEKVELIGGYDDQYLQAISHLLDFGIQNSNVSIRHPNPNCPNHLKFTDEDGYCIDCGEK